MTPVRRSCSGLFAAAVLIAWVTPPAVAQSIDRQLYIRLASGVGITGSSDLRIRQPGRDTDLVFEEVAWDHESLSTDWSRDSIPYIGVRSGIMLGGSRRWGVSAEIVHFKILAPVERQVRVRGSADGTAVDELVPMNRYVQLYHVTNGVNLALGNLEGHYRFARSTAFPEGRAGLFAGVGGGVTIPFTRSWIDGETQGQYEWGRPAGQVFSGFLWRFAPRWGVSAEYKFTGTTVDGAVPGGDSLATLRTHHATIGVTLHPGR